MPSKFTISIPSYNRAVTLAPLLDSIFSQDFQDYDVLICEDRSPQRAQIRSITEGYQKQYPGRITYHENEENLGFDGNIRNLVERATGEYCLFMGNDDLLASGALKTIAAGIAAHPNIGVMLRSYAAFDGNPENIVGTFRYFERERFFPAGAKTAATFFRRSVVIPGLTVHRETALKFRTERFDGVLLYQIHLVLRILLEKNGLFLPQIVSLYRNGGVPDFGNSASERGKFTPTVRTPESSLHFIRGMLEIAKVAEDETGAKVFRPIFDDMGNYSYPLLSIQTDKPVLVFFKYSLDLAKMGFWKYPLFWFYFVSLLLFGPKRMELGMQWIKSRMGHTPSLGKIYRGKAG